jgi:hypothetical protein
MEIEKYYKAKEIMSEINQYERVYNYLTIENDDDPTELQNYVYLAFSYEAYFDKDIMRKIINFILEVFGKKIKQLNSELEEL